MKEGRREGKGKRDGGRKEGKRKKRNVLEGRNKPSLCTPEV